MTTVSLSFRTDPAGRGGRWWRRRWRKALRSSPRRSNRGAPATDGIAVAGGNRQLTGIA